MQLNTQLLLELENYLEPIGKIGLECVSDLDEDQKYDLVTIFLKYEENIYVLDTDCEESEILDFIRLPDVMRHNSPYLFNSILFNLTQLYKSKINDVLGHFFIMYNPEAYRTPEYHYADPVSYDRAQMKTVFEIDNLLF